ncbi:MAG: hypothetical protein ACOWWO_13270 [Peptococcaceae bacterium]
MPRGDRTGRRFWHGLQSSRISEFHGTGFRLWPRIQTDVMDSQADSRLRELLLSMGKL